MVALAHACSHRTTRAGTPLLPMGPSLDRVAAERFSSTGTQHNRPYPVRRVLLLRAMVRSALSRGLSQRMVVLRSPATRSFAARAAPSSCSPRWEATPCGTLTVLV